MIENFIVIVVCIGVGLRHVEFFDGKFGESSSFETWMESTKT
jgi:hypothetical protein